MEISFLEAIIIDLNSTLHVDFLFLNLEVNRMRNAAAHWSFRKSHDEDAF